MTQAPDNDGDVKMSDKSNQVDEDLYSRQLYVMGHEAMKSMQKSNVLIVGMNGIGVEIAKNVILAGVKSVTLLDTSPTTHLDLGSNFYLSQKDVENKTTRGSGVVNKLKELNRYVDVQLLNTDLNDKIISSNQYQVVVLVSYNLKQQIHYNNLCRKHNIKFIACDALGVFGYVFVDFGKDFKIVDVDGEQPFNGLISIIEKGDPGIVRTHDESRHGLSSGDFVTFEEVEGMTELNGCEPREIKVVSPYSFSIGDTSSFNEYTGQGKFLQVKQQKVVSYDSLEDQLKTPSLMCSDYGKDPNFHDLFYKALNKFRESHNDTLPNPCSREDSDEVVKIAVELNKSMKELKLDEKLIWKLARCSQGLINPMAASLGGIVGQEILKACTGKFTPIKQLFYFDVAESLQDYDSYGNDLSGFKPQNCRYDSNLIVYGRALQDKLLSSRMFLVGSGAIGSEMLKNFALLGVGCGKDGKIIVTDMDNIETSNLNRQFLFRNSDVGQAKSTVGARVGKEMNRDMNITPHLNRVGESSEHIYNDVFWTGLTCVCNALDNVQARLYVDTQCVNYKLPLLESGTLGTKGNTQVVVPHLTESYGSQRDPPEKDIPICTLKNFPHKIEHTIQWARDDFEGIFNQIPSECNNYISDKDYLENLSKESNRELDTLRSLKAYLNDHKPVKFEDCVHWARLKFEDEFNNKIQQLLFNFPIDSLTSTGAKFWSGSKRAPSAIAFDENDPVHLGFIVAGANLYAFLFNITGTRDEKEVKKHIKTCNIPVFKPKEGVKIASSEEEMKEMNEKKDDDEEKDDEYDNVVKELVSALPERSLLSGLTLQVAEFEKDDDNNFHMDYITACSNLRARNYRIKEASKHETKGIAGKIIPAIATTTALVSGLIIAEYIKMLQDKKDLESYRNAFINLAVPLCIMGEPATCGETVVELSGKGNLKEYKYSLWDKIEIPNGKNMTLQNLMDYFENEFDLEVNMLSYGSALLYAFFHGESKKNKRKKAKLRKLVEVVTEKKIPKTQKYLMFEAGLVNDDDDDVEVPTIRVDISQ